MPAQSGGKESKIETYKGLEHFNRRFRYTRLLIASAEGFGLEHVFFYYVIKYNYFSSGSFDP